MSYSLRYYILYIVNKNLQQTCTLYLTSDIAYLWSVLRDEKSRLNDTKLKDARHLT